MGSGCHGARKGDRNDYSRLLNGWMDARRADVALGPEAVVGDNNHDGTSHGQRARLGVASSRLKEVQ